MCTALLGPYVQAWHSTRWYVPSDGFLFELFYVINTNFFDDFCRLERSELCDSARQTLELVMRLLGWRISMSEVAKEFNLLGAVVDLSSATQGVVSVHNKPSRISDLQELVNNICNSQ